MSIYQLDVPELRRRLDAQRLERGLTWQQLAALVGVSPSTFSRLADDKRPDADALVTLLVWLDLDTDIALMIKPKETP
ncbi:helix-turn-helix domain-containing protein [Streptomyces liliifuscus]|uniref:Helix-turn-helix transcriptional regulator n=1 Tax=Streptomyces liliifuscus TaxID=2797636 RepID=A0A7T7L2B6_9ACTN|nr:helix-turn-helix transcriptional regulator [Streptomyces liliifuscus]QQM45145.1 helix-turn-helix transcriptional regulator [Streptomyces liliifuscus]